MSSKKTSRRTPRILSSSDSEAADSDGSTKTQYKKKVKVQEEVLARKDRAIEKKDSIIKKNLNILEMKTGRIVHLQGEVKMLKDKMKDFVNLFNDEKTYDIEELIEYGLDKKGNRWYRPKWENNHWVIEGDLVAHDAMVENLMKTNPEPVGLIEDGKWIRAYYPSPQTAGNSPVVDSASVGADSSLAMTGNDNSPLGNDNSLVVTESDRSQREGIGGHVDPPSVNGNPSPTTRESSTNSKAAQWIENLPRPNQQKTQEGDDQLSVFTWGSRDTDLSAQSVISLSDFIPPNQHLKPINVNGKDVFVCPVGGCPLGEIEGVRFRGFASRDSLKKGHFNPVHRDAGIRQANREKNKKKERNPSTQVSMYCETVYSEKDGLNSESETNV